MSEKRNDILVLENYSIAYRKWEGGYFISGDKFLENQSFRFKEGHIYGIVGYTGCGKSTFLRQIAQLNDGEKIWTSGTMKMLPEARTSLVMQQPFSTFNPLMSVYEHLAETFGKSELKPSQKERINAHLLRYRLWDINDPKLLKRSAEFSVGQLQRISWVMAIASEAEMILLDEPFAHVDMDSVKLFVEDLKKCKKEGKTIMIASHLRKQIKEICDEVLLMENGGFLPYSEVLADRGNSDIEVDQTQPPIVKVENLTYSRKDKRRGDIIILNKLNLEVRPGEVRGIYGESGSGKTTLARILAGRIQDYTGEILYNGKEALSIARKERATAIQYLPQDPVDVFPQSLRVRNFIADLVLLHKVDNEYIKNLRKDMPIIQEIENKYISELSGGQRQVLLFYSAILINPQILIIDENFTAMDLNLMEMMWRAVRKWQMSNNVGIILISHQIDDLKRLCSSVSSMEDLQNG